MKIVVSYISSKYSKKETIKLIDTSIADGIHIDLMDGVYVPNKNFSTLELLQLFEGIKKPLDVHLMCDKPSKYFELLYKLKPVAIYIHMGTEEDIASVLKDITNHGIDAGIVINPNQDINLFKPFFPLVKRVLLMSVVPGKGGQEFITSTSKRLEKLTEYRRRYDFLIYVDGGINDETVNFVSDADGVVSGSYICLADDFNLQINKLKEAKK